MVKIVSGGSKVGVDSVGIVCVDVGLEGACRAPGRELKLANTHFSRFYYLPDLESATDVSSGLASVGDRVVHRAGR